MTVSGLALVPRRGGRAFPSSRLVRLGDVLPSGGVRLDAIARYLQDIAADDGRDAGIVDHMAWLVRKTILRIDRRPGLEEELELVTWASGSGARWAERRTTISVGGTPVIEAASLWVCVDLRTMRPSRIPDRFWVMYREAVGDRVVSSRLSLPEVPPGDGIEARPWPLRITDLDVLGHVNNAATWAAIEDQFHQAGRGRSLRGADLEYRAPIDGSFATSVASQVRGDVMYVWLTANGAVLAAAALTMGNP